MKNVIPFPQFKNVHPCASLYEAEYKIANTYDLYDGQIFELNGQYYAVITTRCMTQCIKNMAKEFKQ